MKKLKTIFITSDNYFRNLILFQLILCVILIIALSNGNILKLFM